MLVAGFGVSTQDHGVQGAYEENTVKDHRVFVAIVTAVALSLTVAGFLIRSYIRYTVAGFSLDDWISSSASALAAVQSVMVFIQIFKGFGNDPRILLPEEQESMLKVSR